MNKSAIQKFAIWVRTELIAQVSQRAYQYGIDEKGCGDSNAVAVSGRVLSSDERKQRQELIAQIQRKGYKQVMEEVAYTWFNRFIALHFMEVNNYLPSHIRVFSDDSGGFSPEILKDVLHLDLPGLDKGRIAAYIESNESEALYRYLLLTQCNALNEALPNMFERMGGYTELLFPNNILRPESILGRMVADIPEEHWKDAVQIIGWMYQYYNTEPKQAVFDGLKKNVKITKEKIPAATQLFTPDWIVRYMVENSLGRLWLESHPNDALKANWKYYLDEAEQTPEVAEKLRVMRSQSPVKSPEDIRLIDPCMGSGHILVYSFDVLMQIYESEGYNPRDAAKLILEKNIYGLDIDRRAYQLAYFSLMMKARQYNRRIFTEGIKPQVYHPAGFPDGEEYGSLVKVDKLEPMPELPKEQQMTLFDGSYEAKLNAWNFKRLLAQKYDVVVTNPPYMGASGMGAKMSDYVKNNYPDSKSDLFAVFIEKCGELLKPTGYQAMITQHAWMFQSSFSSLRIKMLQRQLVNEVHLGVKAFDGDVGTVVQTVSFVISNVRIKHFNATFIDLTAQQSQAEKEAQFDISPRYHCVTDSFRLLPGQPYAYWISSNVTKVFAQYKPLDVIAEPRQGLTTCDNDRFVRNWHEVDLTNIRFDCESIDSCQADNRKWFPFVKGGKPRRWYGNLELVVNWQNNGSEMKAYVASKYVSYTRTIKNIPYYFKRGLTWSAISTRFAVRLLPEGQIFADKGQAVFCGDDDFYYLCALLNSVYSEMILQIITPTLDYNCGYVKLIPIAKAANQIDSVNEKSQENIDVCKNDWDSYEVSWNFKWHPLICGKRTVAAAYDKWERDAAERFNTLKANEEELNRIFIGIYGLQDELTPEVEDKDVTVRRADLGREIRSLISYAVGCMFGRYSLDIERLAYAGGDWDNSKYITFIPDKDNILPICDDEYFDDDITGRFVQFVKTVYGTDMLEENLKFIADALGGSGTPREVIRSYFQNGFYADHLKVYQKRPIYWLFDSGKKNGFKALTYMHRYSRDLLARMRTDYVHEQQERYRTQLAQISDALTHASGSEAVKLSKRQQKIQEQALELQKYEEKIHHLADQNIEIDLDDGVVHNYALFEDVLAVIK